MKDEVLIYSWVGEENIGDELILKSIVRMIEKIDDRLKVNVMGTKPKVINKIHNHLGLNRISTYINWTLKSILRAILKHNIFKAILNILCSNKLIIASGGALSDWNPSSTKTIFFLIDLFYFMNRPICMMGVGAGPILHEKSKKRFYNKLKKLEVITVRDEESYELLKSIGLKNVILTSDSVFNICSIIQNKYPEKDVTEKKISFVLAKLFKDNTKELKEYKEEIIKTINRLKKENWKIKLVPFHYSEDIGFLKSINQKCNVEILNSHDMYDTIGELNNENIIVGMRYHSVIMSLVLGKKVIPLIYHPKVYSVARRFEILDIAENVGNGGNWIGSNISSERLLKNIEKLYKSDENTAKNRGKVLRIVKQNDLNNEILARFLRHSNVLEVVSYNVQRH
ncbi:polysaccharide pyruvyl transferase WcaK-like protein [Clostridium acetobutylicum]|uniref:AMSJ/WSAK related protein, possibly involved in exopolysaccharide biosynthesis n=1 Tax=Clostridium acetobutylicum (strain ATCC 824 / DSM 792 / JCM 1419 / IAM 19013 / LMG 5710 / NBRC 13948 / NRRL B-527 / VKM B-1787 / 2291 / W) TaxID=272562 RepID=Q97EQ8_CLOAB|nr:MULTISPECIES: polysaccharide pyruvyl transferase family protein [Clostridium]AAK80990.1 AMSJ/WSAK related protein, possibly involved in exopolysaccharide biosynthesis [Clostridium acetobutylicum ATCC 824]ADZ22093.1 AMSJ/WSAK related protein [Clostridium acetobutylicum EA 2018]AEI32667.1 hypothetical protein SMB_G3086 [Clostridium acetobutylicum DSM 1731]AWV78599.1 hypothetical protein DK921_00435 [Clostridium acetobutylicum]MBC2393459.1 hypothetical protein [Clostridium acetobutylicum]